MNTIKKRGRRRTDKLVNTNMDPDHNNTTGTDKTNSNTDEAVSFSRVTAVASEWMLDFFFVSLCRSFKKAELEGFKEKLSIFESICQSPSLTVDLLEEKMMIINFLARVMHGKQLDVHFDDDDGVMPLMSAAKIWSKLGDTVADDSVFENITVLLLVQSVAVCLEKGQRCSASSVLKWFENNHEFPKNVRVKLSTIVTKNETYHPFLTSFSFSRLLEKIQCYLDAYLEKNPCDYLLKEATKIVQSSQNKECLEDVVTQDSTVSVENKENQTKCLSRKRQLLPTNITDLWEPDTCKRLYVSIQGLSKNELSRMKNLPTPKLTQATSEMLKKTSVTRKPRKPPQKWTPQLDKYLKNGVKRHGQGKWSLILNDYDFEGRTGTMLKDRWRVLIKTDKVG